MFLLGTLQINGGKETHFLLLLWDEKKKRKALQSFHFPMRFPLLEADGGGISLFVCSFFLSLRDAEIYWISTETSCWVIYDSGRHTAG